VSGSTTFDTNQGQQMIFFKNVLAKASSGFNPLPAPSNVHVTGSGDTTVSLAWDNVQGATDYAVFRDGSQVTASVSSGSFVDTGLMTGSTYMYTVAGVDSRGNQGPQSSPPVSGTTTGPPPPITPPTGLQVVSVAAASVALAWRPVNMASGYYVYRNGARVSRVVTTTSYTDSGLSPSTTYQYTASALRGSTESSQSQPVSATTASSWTCKTFSDDNYDHVESGRATQDMGECYSKGAAQYMGLYNVATWTTLAEIKQDYNIVGNCPTA